MCTDAPGGTEHTELANRKMPLVLKDFETAFGAYNRHISQISLIRGWSLTLTTLYLGFVATRPIAASLLIPACGILVMFVALEAKELAYKRFNTETVLEVERMFMMRDAATFVEGVSNYEFRDLRIKRELPTRTARWNALARQVRPLMLLWYIALAAIIGLSRILVAHG